MAKEEFVLDSNIDQLFENLPIGSISRAIGNNLYGINFRQTPSFVPRAKEHYGFTFFTRPQLNLSRSNISNFRTFYSLLSRSTVSYQSYVRAMLDPRLSLNNNKVSSFVNNENPFIPILTNSLVSLSGFPDLTVPTYTSDTGLYGQEISFVDGTVNHYESYDIDATFANYKGNPLEISFSGRYVFDAVRVLNGSIVKLEFSGEMKPFIIRNVDDDSILQLILPVRTYS